MVGPFLWVRQGPSDPGARVAGDPGRTLITNFYRPYFLKSLLWNKY